VTDIHTYRRRRDGQATAQRALHTCRRALTTDNKIISQYREVGAERHEASSNVSPPVFLGVKVMITDDGKHEHDDY